MTRHRGNSAGRRAGPRGRGNSTQRPATEVGRYGRFAPLAESDGGEQEIPDLVPDLESEEDETAGFSVPSLTYWMSLLSMQRGARPNTAQPGGESLGDFRARPAAPGVQT